jgi:hypothetical protein
MSGGNTSHGALKFWRKGILPPYRKALSDHVDKIIEAITDDLGGQESLTATQGVLLGQLRKCLIFQGLIDTWLSKQKVFVDEKGGLPPCLSGFYLSAMNTSIRLSLELGLERKTPAQSLEGYLEAKAQAAASEGTPKVTGKRAGHKKIDPGATSQGIPGGDE